MIVEKLLKNNKIPFHLQIKKQSKNKKNKNKIPKKEKNF
jgi:hypothetical protein